MENNIEIFRHVPNSCFGFAKYFGTIVPFVKSVESDGVNLDIVMHLASIGAKNPIVASIIERAYITMKRLMQLQESDMKDFQQK